MPKNQPLIPLFEAIVNSIHAIEERHKRLEKDPAIEKIEASQEHDRDAFYETGEKIFVITNFGAQLIDCCID